MSQRRVVLAGRMAFALIAVALVVGTSVQSFSQDAPPKVDIFGGYSWYNPGGNLSAPINKVPSIAKGWGLAPTFNVNKWLGFTADIGGHYKEEANVHTFLFGPRFKYRNDQFSPFMELLAGFARVAPAGNNEANAPAFAGGGGFDMGINKYLSFRVLQADYIYTTYKDKKLAFPAKFRWDGARLQSGLVLNLGGGAPPVPATSTCTASTSEIMAGEPVKVTMATQNFNPKRTVSYSWATTGGKVAGTETSTNVDTAGLAPGSYKVTGTATDNGKGKNQMVTSCSASFTVKEPPKNPPTMSCSANPTTVKSGDPSTVSCNCTSPDGRPVQVAYTATGGKFNGSGATGTLDTAGAPAGPITVNATCTDDRGLSANGNASVNVEVPPPPPTASKLGQCDFPNKVKPWRVDNACKAVLDGVALALQRQADAKVVVVGHADPAELKSKKNATLAAQRAVNSKAYLVSGEAQQQIDPTRIEVRTGDPSGMTAEYWIVPAGANFEGQGTQPVDESKVKAQGRTPAPAAKKTTKKPAAPKQ
jgi:OmpA family